MSKATFNITTDGGVTTVHVSRDYPGAELPTAPRVWEIVSDYGALKKVFPSLVRVTVNYPDDQTTAINTSRDMTFQTPNGASVGIEQLVELDEENRWLKYISVLGLPVTNYESVMEVSGDNACTLNWTSTFTPNQGNEDFAKTLAFILSGGADQIAAALGLD